MYLSEINLKSFQGFKRQQNIRLAPLTFIFGPNSAGKSSVIRSLLLGKQNLLRQATPDSNFPWRFAGEDVDLAGFSNTVYNHTGEFIHLGFAISLADLTEKPHKMAETIEEIKFSYRINSDELVSAFSLQYGLKTPNKSEAEKSFALKFELLEGAWVAKFENLNSSEAFSQLIDTFAPSPHQGAKTKNTNELGARRLNQALKTFAINFRDAVPRFLQDESTSNLDSEAQALYRKTDDFRILRALNNACELASALLKVEFGTIRHVGALREIPKRFTLIEKVAQRSISRTNTDISGFLSDDEARKLASKWLLKLTGKAYELRFNKLNDGANNWVGNLASLTLFDRHTKTNVGFQDVGVGLSQLLPIITNLVIKVGTNPNQIVKNKDKHNLLLIEQPELHLHPKLQGDLADLLIDTSMLKIPGGPQIVAETHSENMIMRIQKRVREGVIRPEDVAILFVDRVPGKNGGNSVIEIGLDETGELAFELPISFTDLRIQDRF